MNKNEEFNIHFTSIIACRIMIGTIAHSIVVVVVVVVVIETVHNRTRCRNEEE